MKRLVTSIHGALKRTLSKLPARALIAGGITSLLTTLILIGYFAGFVPDRAAEQYAGRVGTSEALAVSGSALLKRGDLEGLRRVLDFVVERNDDLQGVELKRDWNDEIVSFGDVPELLSFDETEPALHRVIVPLLRGGRDWGELRFHFTEMGSQGGISGAWDVFRASPFGFMIFAALLGFPAILFYLSRVLKQLDPKAAVPGRVRSALDSIAECLVVLDRNGQLVLANAAFTELSGRTSESLIGESLDSLDWSMSDDSSGTERPWHRALDSGESVRQASAAYIDTMGERRSFQVNCSPVYGAEGQIGGVLVSMDDVTRMEEQEQALREAMELAEEASVAKSAFLSNMSHEIRTPLTAILGFTEVLRRGAAADPSERAKHLQTISNSGTHLLNLINDLLDLSKVESGNMEVEIIDTEIADLAFDVLDVLRVKAEEKSIGLDVEVFTDIPERIASDPSRLRQIITNLVGNAIKFTEKGAVQVRLACDPDAEQCRISIVDSGIGMDEEQQARIFDAFTQADVTVTRRFGGTGLGLSISKNLAEALGGSISVESTPGVGSTFHLDIPTGSLADVAMVPADKVSELARRTHAVAGTTWKFVNRTVLVVDDALENRELLSLVLEDVGIAYETACDGQEAVDAVAAGNFDAVLMDAQMPIMDGYEAVGVMRERGYERPVIGLTADAMVGIEERILAAGFSHYRTKPIDIDALIALLADLLGGEAVEPDMSQDSADVTADFAECVTKTETDIGADSECTDTPVHSTLLDENPRFRGIVERFIPRLDEQLEAIRGFIETEDMEALAATAHWLKGSGGNVGYAGFTKPAARLQAAAETKDDQLITSSMEEIEAYAARVRAGWFGAESANDPDVSEPRRVGT